jgi:2-keto-3-deoxy-L-rhamnonate aldolase RhmA
LYVGPGDLSVDLGVPGQWSAPVLQTALARVAEACRNHGKIMACHADRVQDMPRLRDLGVQMFGYFCDIGLFKAAAAGVAAEFRQTLG